MPEARASVGSGISKERFNELRDIVDKAAQVIDTLPAVFLDCCFEDK